MTEEIWRDIENYEGLYQVSNLGRVRNSEGYIMSYHIDKDGYCRICLSKHSHKSTFGIHRLVAQAFIPNPDNLPQVNHKSEVKTDNFVENLEWCDAKYNTTYGTCKERMANTKRGSFHQSDSVKKKLSEARKIPVIQYTEDGVLVNKWNSIKDAQEATKINHISKCCRGISDYSHY